MNVRTCEPKLYTICCGLRAGVRTLRGVVSSGQFLPDLPDLPERPEEREAEGLELDLGVDGRAKLRDGDDVVRPDRTAEDPLERKMDRMELLVVERERPGLLDDVLGLLSVMDPLLSWDLEFRDSSCREVRGMSVLRSGIVVMRSSDLDPGRLFLLSGESVRFGARDPGCSGAGEGRSMVLFGVPGDVGRAGVGAGD